MPLIKEELRNCKLPIVNKIFFVAIAITIMACGNNTSLIPKPRAYPKVEFPVRKYEIFESEYCPEIRFEKPTYTKVVKDVRNKEQNQYHPCWFDLTAEQLQGRIHCSYIPISHDTIFARLVKESFKVVDHVNRRSNFVEETVISKEGLGGVLFTFEGPAASQMQFFLTDSTNHFFKASLYFFSKTNPDSIAPVAEFIQQDMLHMIESFEWASNK